MGMEKLLFPSLIIFVKMLVPKKETSPMLDVAKSTF
jgi:hypothetical protein